MLEVFRVSDLAQNQFAAWLQTLRPETEEISRIDRGDGSLVFLVKNTGKQRIEDSKIPGNGVSVKRLSQPEFNFEFADYGVMEDILRGASDETLGAEYIRDLIRNSVEGARPVTVRVIGDGTYVIIHKDGKLVPVPVQ